MTGLTRAIAEPDLEQDISVQSPAEPDRSTADRAARDAGIVAATQALILEVARAASHRELDAVLLTIVERAARLGPVESVGIALVDRAGRLISRAEADAPPWPARPTGTTALGSTWPLDLAELCGPRPFLVTETSPMLAQDDERLLRMHGAAAVLTLPLIAGDDPLGAIQARSTSADAFDSDDIERWREIARQTAATVQTIHANANASREAERQSILRQASDIIARATDRRTAFRQISELGLRLPGVEACGIQLWDEATGLIEVGFEVTVPTWPGVAEPGKLLTPTEAWPFPVMLEERLPIHHWVGDPSLPAEGATFMAGVEVGCLLECPMLAEGRLLGSLGFYARGAAPFSDATQALAAELATQTALVVREMMVRELSARVSDERAMLLRVSTAANSSLDLAVVLREVVEATIGVAGAERCKIDLLDAARGEYEVGALATVVDWPPEDELTIGSRYPVGGWSIDATVTTSRRPVVVNALADPYVNGEMARDLERIGAASVVMCPLWAEDRYIGALSVLSRRPGAFRSDDVTLMREVAQRATAAIQNARRHSEERARADRQTALLRVSRAATSSLDLYPVLQEVCAACLGIDGAESTEVQLYDARHAEFEVAALAFDPGCGHTVEPGARFAFGYWERIDPLITGQREPIVVVGSDDPLVCANLRRKMTTDRIGSLLVVPLWHVDICHGALVLFSRLAATFSAEHLSLAAQIAQQATIAIQNARLLERERRAALERALFLEITTAAGSDVPPAELLRLIARAGLSVPGTESCEIDLYDHTRRELEIGALVTVDDWADAFRATAGDRYPVDHWVLDAQAIAGAAPIVVGDRDDPRLDDTMRTECADHAIRSMLLFPLRSHGQPLGLFSLFSRRPGVFEAPELALAAELAARAGAAIQHAFATERERNLATHRGTLLRISAAATSSLDLPTILNQVAAELKAATGVPALIIELWRPDEDVFEVALSLSEPGAVHVPAKATRFPRTAFAVNERILTSTTPFAIDLSPGGSTHPDRDRLAARGAATMVCSPLWANERCLGVVTLYDARANLLDDAMSALLEEASGHIALAIANSRLIETERRRSLERAVLVEVGRAATADLALDEKLRLISCACLAIPEVECASVTNFLPERGLTVIVADVSVDDWGDDDPPGTIHPLADRPTCAAWLATGEPTVHDIDDPACAPDVRAEIVAFGGRTSLWVGLRVGEAIIGNLSFHSREHGAFTPATVAVATEIAGQVSLTIRNGRLIEAERRRSLERAVLLEVGRATTSDLPLDEKLRRVAEACLAIPEVEGATVTNYFPEQGVTLTVADVAIDDWPVEDPPGTSYPLPEIPWLDDWLSHGLPRINDLDDPHIPAEMAAEIRGFGGQASLWVGLRLADETFGGLGLHTRQRGVLNDATTAIAVEIAAQISLTIRNSRLLEETHRRAAEQEALLKTSQAATSSLDIDVMLTEASRALREVTRTEAIAVERWIPEDDAFQLATRDAVWDWTGDDPLGTRYPRAAVDFYDRILADRRAWTIGPADVPAGHRFLERVALHGVQSLLIAPLWTQDTCLGAIAMIDRRPNYYTPAMVQLAEQAAGQIALALANVDLLGRERQRADDRATLLQISREVTASRDLATALGAAAESLRLGTGFDIVEIERWRPELDLFEVVGTSACSVSDLADPLGLRTRRADFDIYDRVLANAGPVSLRSSELPVGSRERDTLERYEIESTILTPLTAHDQVVGLLGLYALADAPIPDRVVRLAEEAAGHIALAMANADLLEQERRQALEHTVMVKVGQAAIAATDLDDKLLEIANICLELPEVEGATIEYWYPGRMIAEIAADVTVPDWGDPDPPGKRYAVDPEDWIVDWRAGAGALVFDAADPALAPRTRADILGYGAATSLWDGIRLDDEVAVLVGFHSRASGVFTTETTRFAATIAAQTGLAIRNARLLAETQRHANEQAALLRVSRAVTTVTPESLPDTLRQIAALSMSVVDADLCEILLWHRDVDATEIVAQVTSPAWTGDHEEMNVLLPLAGRTVALDVLHERRAVVMRPEADYTPSEMERIWSDGTRSGLAAPLVFGNRAIGLIGYFTSRPDAFDEHHASLAVDLGAQTALAIERATTLAALAEQATTDGLTGLLNHRAVRDRLDVELLRAQRHDETVAVCMVDLNRFKQINDTHGHLVGDQVLQHAASILKAATRQTDIVGRYGGDEFLVVLPDTDAVEAVVVADRMLAYAAKTTIPLPNGDLLTLSLSIGFAVYPTDAESRPLLVEAADRAMYDAKAKTRRPLAHGTGPLRPLAITG